MSQEPVRTLVHTPVRKTVGTKELAEAVSFRQACVNRFGACGIVGCELTILWRTADGHQTETRSSGPVGGRSTAIRVLAAVA